MVRNKLPPSERHSKCEGTGHGTRYGRACKGCGGTGSAVVAFDKRMRNQYNWEEVSGSTAENYLPDLLDSYLVARYGSADSEVPIDWREEDDHGPTPAQIYTVMEHSIDHKALFTVCELARSNFHAVYTFLAKEDDRVMKDWKENV